MQNERKNSPLSRHTAMGRLLRYNLSIYMMNSLKSIRAEKSVKNINYAVMFQTVFIKMRSRDYLRTNELLVIF